MLDRTGGSDGARTRDLRRDRPDAQTENAKISMAGEHSRLRERTPTSAKVFTGNASGPGGGGAPVEAAFGGVSGQVAADATRASANQARLRRDRGSARNGRGPGRGRAPAEAAFAIPKV